jgi:penicillin amidase
MPFSRAKLFAGVLSLLVLLALAAVFFIRYQIQKSFSQTEGSLSVPGLQKPVEIRRDEFGVPTIVAQSEQDAVFAEGYVHAQDRLWQMDLQRRAASGRLSELFGESTVSFDRMFRIIGLRHTAERLLGALPPETQQYLQWYADGVNAFVDGHRGRSPLEFDLLRYDPEPWTALDGLLVARLLAWELSLSWWTDLTMGAIVDRVGPERFQEIMPSYPPDVPPTVPTVKGKHFGSLTEGFRQVGSAYLDFIGAHAFATGSNAWAVAPGHSSTGGVLLANDTHLELSLPPQWYEVQLRFPGHTLGGMSVPGVPGVVAGRNDSIAWGMTNLMADDADYYIERLDSVTGTSFWSGSQWRPLTIRTEEIGVRGASALPLTIRQTAHGPIVTDIRTPLQRSSSPFVASMRWTGAEIDDQIGAFRAIDRATDWKSFSEGVRKFAVPGQNFVYGDVHGHIGYRCGVRLPIRGKENSLLPQPGWEKSSDWKGFVPFDQLPALLDPPEGFIASANNKVVDDRYPYHITDLWEPPSRIERLREVLGRPKEFFSVEDFERLQNDTYSFHAREIVPYIFAAFADSTRVEESDRTMLEYLRNWNFYFARDDIATSIYQEFFVHLLQNTYRDELGEELFHDWVILVNIPIRVTTRLLQQGTSPWFDDTGTPGIVENRDDIVRKSLREAGRELTKRLGEDPKHWRWGELHTVTLKHPFGLIQPFDRIFNLGPYPIGGGSTSLISCEYSFNAPFAVTVGPSFRQIFDLANPAEVRSILPSGQSGQLFHPHYDDQTRLWLNGGYRIVRRDGGGGHVEILRLVPS